MDWKRTDKELPTERGRYLTYMPYMDSILITFWNNRKFEIGGNISHWMELPDKPNNYVEVGLNKGWLIEIDDLP